MRLCFGPWCFLANANGELGSLNWRLLEDFNQFYIVIVGIFAVLLFVIEILPSTGRRVMGPQGEKPEFSDFAWFSLMFGAGLGVGLMVFATAEPLGLWGSNLVVSSGAVAADSEDALQSGFRYTFLHYGFHAWAIYVVTGLSLAYYAYTRDMPLTIWSAPTPLFGSMMNGFLGHVVDVLGVVYAAGEQGRQFGWTSFYWAWWIAFSPFVGLFLARISKGRSVREFIVGCVIVPALVCFAWMTILGGTAIDLELSGVADGAIIGATNTAKLFVTLEAMLSSGVFLGAITIMSVVLIMTFLVTSADSGILVMNTIMSGGAEEATVKHRIDWGVILTLVIGTLLIAGTSGDADPMDALRSAMIIGALPFTMVMGLMCVALVKAIYRDGLREKHGVSEK